VIHQASQGAGIQSAQNAVEAGADVIIVLNLGPKAFRVLNQSGIDIYIGSPSTVKENISLMKNGQLPKMTDANVEGHWV
jgi:predicted Fe-Mo cluster-binding NifX family protein